MTTNLTRATGRTIAIASVFGIVMTMSARPIAHTRAPSSLRCDGTWLSRTAEQGLARSGTLRSLIAELERAHVIVFARISHDLASGIGGRTRFVGHGDGWRFLSIEIDDRRPKVDVLSMLGHELQHAVEVARTPEVVDDETLGALYERIGFCRKVCKCQADLETQAAIDVEKRVYTELFVGRSED